MEQAERDKMLREMAQHRGFKLVKSRRRKPGGDFGRYGLTMRRRGRTASGSARAGSKPRLMRSRIICAARQRRPGSAR
jgi:hypothetical protein